MHPVDGIQTPPYKEDEFHDLPAISKQVHEMPMMPTTEWAIESGEWKNIVQAYLASVTFVDNYIGEVLNALENSKYKDNTIIILWSDHGYQLGEKGTFAKHALWQEATNAPLIISVPEGQKGLIREQAVEMLDIYPTLLDLCGLPPNTRNEGKSLKPLLENTQLNDEYFAVTTYGRNNHAVVSRRYRYIHYENGAEELYDHENDPNEWQNIANDITNSAIIQMHRQRLPERNALWTLSGKNNSVNTYFEKQRAEQSYKQGLKIKKTEK
jgi:arylsulfatase A-like enzyme